MNGDEAAAVPDWVARLHHGAEVTPEQHHHDHHKELEFWQAQRDQALAEVERLRGERNYWMAKQHEYATDVRNVRIERDMALDEEARSQAEWRRLGAEVERLRAALEGIANHPYILLTDDLIDVAGWFVNEARRALSPNTREASDG